MTHTQIYSAGFRIGEAVEVSVETHQSDMSDVFGWLAGGI